MSGDRARAHNPKVAGSNPAPATKDEWRPRSATWVFLVGFTFYRDQVVFFRRFFRVFSDTWAGGRTLRTISCSTAARKEPAVYVETGSAGLWNR